MTTSKDDFMAHRRRQENETAATTVDADNPLRSLVTVELNTTELCNRTCVFCPHGHPETYPNRPLHLTVDRVAKVADDLAGLGFRGRISFSGFGEPILNRAFPRLIRAARERLPANQIDTNTNGDRLTADAIATLYDAGLTYIYVNLYDGPHQRRHFESLFADAGAPPERYHLRPHWSGLDEHYGLILNNRSGLVDTAPGGMAAPLERPCYYPFSHAMIDWNGDMLLCSNDWGRALIVGNVIERNFGEVWMSDLMLEARRRLMVGDRRHSPCATCNVDGTLSGRYGFDVLVRYYRAHGAIPKGALPAGHDVPAGDPPAVPGDGAPRPTPAA